MKVSADIDMTDAVEFVGRKGVTFLKKKVMSVEIPVEFKGKFLRLDSNNGEISYVVAKPLSPGEKAARKVARESAAQARREEKKKIQAARVAKGQKLRSVKSAAFAAWKKDLLNESLRTKYLAAIAEYEAFKQAR